MDSKPESERSHMAGGWDSPELVTACLPSTLWIWQPCACRIRLSGLRSPTFAYTGLPAWNVLPLHLLSSYFSCKPKEKHFSFYDVFPNFVHVAGPLPLSLLSRYSAPVSSLTTPRPANCVAVCVVSLCSSRPVNVW